MKAYGMSYRNKIAHATSLREVAAITAEIKLLTGMSADTRRKCERVSISVTQRLERKA